MGWLILAVIVILILDSRYCEEFNKHERLIKKLQRQVDKHEQRWHHNKDTGRVWWQRKDD